MSDTHSQLGILVKAVQHKNLSSAASHVGLSQPQLSRIIAKLEEELQVVLLDRGVRRKSAWTEFAFKLVEAYQKSENSLQAEIQKIIKKPLNSRIRFGTLEGLSQFGFEYAHKLFSNTKLHELHLDIYEISELEEKFESGNLDIIFSFRIPGKQKFKNVIEVGYQSVDKVVIDRDYQVLSPYEYTQKQNEYKKSKARFFVSNSLELRKQWLENVGGMGWLPSVVLSAPGDGKTPVYLVGSELLSPFVWEEIKRQDPEI
jgi:DNA-binding transcriptional LysR family regulator